MANSNTIAFIFAVNLATLGVAQAADCNDYPFTTGMNIEDVDGGVRIISTSSVPVSFDDQSALKDARDEATLEAKAQISAFMSEGVRSDQAIAKAVSETKTMNGNDKEAVRKELVARVKVLASSTQALLRGVVPLGECYTKGKELRVSIGIKPETVRSAQDLQRNMRSRGDSTSQEPRSAPPSNRTEGYSDTERLKRF